MTITPDPWVACVEMEYGDDRSFASAVRAQVIDATEEDRPSIEEHLLESLALPGCTEAGRAFLCRMLALVGSAKSVPVLGALLRDPKSTEAARLALHSIPGSEADATLRNALEALTGPAKAGLIGTIAVRGDRTAYAALERVKNDPSETGQVREAANRALEHLAAPGL